MESSIKTALSTPSASKATSKDQKMRCFGNKAGQELYAKYHDEEWGVPVHDERLLFEMLSLEGAQAGLSFETILKRRENYKALFHQFDPFKVSQMSNGQLEEILQNPGVIRNRKKVFSTRENAKVFLKIQEEFGSFDFYFWSFVNHKPLINDWQEAKEVPCRSDISDAISKDLKKRKMSFVGTKIIYAFMQAAGLVNDHLADCIVRGCC